MEEIQISAELHLVGEFSKSTKPGQQKSLIRFEVWLNIYDHDVDTEITKQFTTEQLESLKSDFIEKYEERTAFVAATAESRGCDAYHLAKEEGYPV